ncbi:MAG: hypothetical protein ACJ789_00815 [Thermomicrobiales bacterium]
MKQDDSAPNQAVGFTPEQLGFEPATGDLGEATPSAWQRTLGGRVVTFRMLRTLEELAYAEDLQRDVFGVTDYDLISAGELIVVHETGGEVIGAFVDEHSGEQAVGCLFGWGGFVDGRPRIVSDFMAVRKTMRSGRIGASLKRLQAAIALARGFQEIIWTVDPLRAANARLNFGKLGAYADRYIENLYGETYGEAIYGGLPSDRIQVTWPIASPAVQRHLVQADHASAEIEPAAAAVFDARRPEVERALIPIPKNIDTIVKSDRAAARAWRMRLRGELQVAFAAGLAITGFVSDVDPGQELAAYVVERTTRGKG